MTTLSTLLREHTAAAHRRVEGTPFVRALIAGRLDRAAYGLLLRSLHEIYAALETGLTAQAGHPALAPLQASAFFRRDALAGDLAFLCGESWPTRLHAQPESLAYAHHLHGLACERPELLAAHAYVRYLGDLSGGQILRRVVARSLDLPDGPGTRFYAFDEPADALAQRLRATLNGQSLEAAARQAIVDEAEAGFVRHERLFAELEAARRGGLTTAS